MDSINYSKTPEGKAQSKRLIECRLELNCNNAREFYDKFSKGRFSYTQYQKYESGERLLSPKAAILYAQIFKKDAEWLKNGDSELSLPQKIKTIYKVGYVQAGIFNEACQLPESEWESITYIADNPYKKCKLFALGVRGNSMDKVFPPEKTILICCPLIEWIDINPHAEINGKYIIAYRKDSTGYCEATVKKYAKIDNNTIKLCAESSDSNITDIILHPDNNEYEIAAVVISYIRNC